MLDTYHVEYYTKDGSRVGINLQAYSSYDIERYVKELPNYNLMASFPEKINTSF